MHTQQIIQSQAERRGVCAEVLSCWHSRLEAFGAGMEGGAAVSVPLCLAVQVGESELLEGRPAPACYACQKLHV
jgi:hypothetical protein